jgi:hypothetical protein
VYPVPNHYFSENLVVPRIEPGAFVSEALKALVRNFMLMNMSEVILVSVVRKKKV